MSRGVVPWILRPMLSDPSRINTRSRDSAPIESAFVKAFAVFGSKSGRANASATTARMSIRPAMRINSVS